MVVNRTQLKRWLRRAETAAAGSKSELEPDVQQEEVEMMEQQQQMEVGQVQQTDLMEEKLQNGEAECGAGLTWQGQQEEEEPRQETKKRSMHVHLPVITVPLEPETL